MVKYIKKIFWGIIVVKILVISVFFINNLYANNFKDTLITLFNYCATEPNREVFVCTNKSEEIKNLLYKKNLDLDFIDTVGTTCFAVCSVPTSLSKIINNLKRR